MFGNFDEKFDWALKNKYAQGQQAQDTSAFNAQTDRNRLVADVGLARQRLGLEAENIRGGLANTAFANATQRGQFAASLLSPFGQGTIDAMGLRGQFKAPQGTPSMAGGGWGLFGGGSPTGGTVEGYASMQNPIAQPATAPAAAPAPTPLTPRGQAYKSTMAPNTNTVTSSLSPEQQTQSRVAQVPREYKRGGKVGNVKNDKGKDTIKAKVRPGEYMLNPETVAHIGGGDYNQGVRKLNQLVRDATGQEPGPTPLGKGRKGFAASGPADLDAMSQRLVAAQEALDTQRTTGPANTPMQQQARQSAERFSAQNAARNAAEVASQQAAGDMQMAREVEAAKQLSAKATAVTNAQIAQRIQALRNPPSADPWTAHQPPEVTAAPQAPTGPAGLDARGNPITTQPLREMPVTAAQRAEANRAFFDRTLTAEQQAELGRQEMAWQRAHGAAAEPLDGLRPQRVQPAAPAAQAPARPAAPVDPMAGEAAIGRTAAPAGPVRPAPLTPEQGGVTPDLRGAAKTASDAAYKEALKGGGTAKQAGEAAARAYEQTMGRTPPPSPAATGVRGMARGALARTDAALAKIPGGRFLGPAAVGFGAYDTMLQSPEEHEAFAKSVGANEAGAGTKGLNTLTNIGNAATFGVAGRVGQAISNAMFTPGDFNTRLNAAAQGFREGPTNGMAPPAPPIDAKPAATPAAAPAAAPSAAPAEPQAVAAPSNYDQPRLAAMGDSVGLRGPMNELRMENQGNNTFAWGRSENGTPVIVGYGRDGGGGGGGMGGGGMGGGGAPMGGTVDNYLAMQRYAAEQKRLQAEFEQKKGTEERKLNVEEQAAAQQRAERVRKGVEDRFGKDSFGNVDRAVSLQTRAVVDNAWKTLNDQKATEKQKDEAWNALNSHGKPVYTVGADGKRRISGFTPLSVSQIEDEGVRAQLLNDYDLGKQIQARSGEVENWYSELAPYAGAAAGLYFTRGRAAAGLRGAATAAQAQGVKGSVRSVGNALKNQKWDYTKKGAGFIAPVATGALAGVAAQDAMRAHHLPPSDNPFDYAPKGLSKDGRYVITNSGQRVLLKDLEQDDAGTLRGMVRSMVPASSESAARHTTSLAARLRGLEREK